MLPLLAQNSFPPFVSDYYAALLRTAHGFLVPQNKLLNYVQRVPLGVVAQITVRSKSIDISVND
jgi:hypothetical protein